MIDRANFLEMLNEIRRCVLAANGEIFEFEIGEPASMELVDEIERRYGVPFPADFVHFLTAVAGKVDISWGKSKKSSIFRAKNIIKPSGQWGFDLVRYCACRKSKADCLL